MLHVWLCRCLDCLTLHKTTASLQQQCAAHILTVALGPKRYTAKQIRKHLLIDLGATVHTIIIANIILSLG